MGAVRVNVPGSQVVYSFVTASSYANLPSVAAEDTVGLITSSSVTKIDVLNDLPSSGMAAGDVVIKPGNAGNNYVNILAKPLVRVYPCGVYRYSGSAWEAIEAYVRRSAAWAILRADFYKVGTTTLIGTLAGSNTGQGGYSIGGSSFTVSLGTGSTTGFACVYGPTAIDITNYSTLKISYTRTRSGSQGSHKARIYLNPTLLTGTNSVFSEGAGGADLPTGTNTVSFNVSAISGSQKIHVGLGKSSYYESDTLVVTDIWGI